MISLMFQFKEKLPKYFESLVTQKKTKVSKDNENKEQVNSRL